MKGRQLKTCSSDLSLGGKCQIQLKTAASPEERKEMLAQGHCSCRIPFFPTLAVGWVFQ